MAKADKDSFFNKDHQTKAKKAERDDSAFRSIADEETLAREKKTAKLRELRLQREAEQPAVVAAPKVKRATKSIKRAAGG